MNVRIETLPTFHIAYMRNIGPYGGQGGIPQLWARLARWAAARGLWNSDAICLGIAHDDPRVTAAGECRFDAAIVVPAGLQVDAEVQITDRPVACYAVDGRLRRAAAERHPRLRCATAARGCGVHRHAGGAGHGDPPRGRCLVPFAAAALLLLLAALVTRFGNQPINAIVMAWSPQAVPAEWIQRRERWWTWHQVRTAAALVALTLTLAGLLFPARRPAADGAVEPTAPR